MSRSSSWWRYIVKRNQFILRALHIEALCLNMALPSAPTADSVVDRPEFHRSRLYRWREEEQDQREHTSRVRLSSSIFIFEIDSISISVLAGGLGNSQSER
jgi:hypothetical protein